MINEFIAKVRLCLQKAALIYDLDMSEVQIKVNIRSDSKCAGKAEYADGIYSVRFHKQAVKNHYNEMVNETIPHEVAHIVCMMKPQLGCNHDFGWKAVCQALGGIGDQYHTMGIGKTKRQRLWDYKTESGEIVQLTTVRHNRLQQNKVEYYSSPKLGKIRKEDWV